MLLFVPTVSCLMNRMQCLTTAFLTLWASCTGDLLRGRYCRSVLRVVLLVLGGLCVGDDPVAASDFHDPKADHHALPAVPEGFEVTVFAKEPMVRQPCSMAFDSRGRLLSEWDRSIATTPKLPVTVWSFCLTRTVTAELMTRKYLPQASMPCRRWHGMGMIFGLPML